MPSFFIPLTGLNADTSALNTIANNLANMSTVGFKARLAQFADLFYQNIGATGNGDPVQVGAGTQISAISTDFSSGTSNFTGLNTNVALQGNGFFVVSDGTNQYLTRAGNFSLDSSGNLITTGGLRVMGYPAANGVVNTNTALTPINIPESAILSPKATGSFSISANLDSATAAASNFPATVNIYDSLGQMHTATVTYTANGNGSWNYSIALPASDLGAAQTVTGVMNFDNKGNLTTIQPTGAAAPSTVGTAAGDVSSIPVAFTGLTDGAANLTMNWNLLGSGGTPTISQVASKSAVSATNQDGYTSGQYPELHDWFRRNRHGHVLESAEDECRPDCSRQRFQPAGDGSHGRRKLCSDAGQRHAHHRNIRQRGSGHHAGRRARRIERKHLGRICESDYCPARLRGEFKISDHLRHHHAGNDSDDPLGLEDCAITLDFPGPGISAPNCAGRGIFLASRRDCWRSSVRRGPVFHWIGIGCGTDFDEQSLAVGQYFSLAVEDVRLGPVLAALVARDAAFEANLF